MKILFSGFEKPHKSDSAAGFLPIQNGSFRRLVMRLRSTLDLRYPTKLLTVSNIPLYKIGPGFDICAAQDNTHVYLIDNARGHKTTTTEETWHTIYKFNVMRGKCVWKSSIQGKSGLPDVLHRDPTLHGQCATEERVDWLLTTHSPSGVQIMFSTPQSFPLYRSLLP